MRRHPRGSAPELRLARGRRQLGGGDQHRLALHHRATADQQLARGGADPSLQVPLGARARSSSSNAAPIDRSGQPRRGRWRRAAGRRRLRPASGVPPARRPPPRSRRRSVHARARRPAGAPSTRARPVRRPRRPGARHGGRHRGPGARRPARDEPGDAPRVRRRCRSPRGPGDDGTRRPRRAGAPAPPPRPGPDRRARAPSDRGASERGQLAAIAGGGHGQHPARALGERCRAVQERLGDPPRHRHGAPEPVSARLADSGRPPVGRADYPPSPRYIRSPTFSSAMGPRPPE